MELVYILLGGLCVAAEISNKWNTDNLIEKIAIGSIAVGCLIHLASKPNLLIELGLIAFMAQRLLKAHFYVKRRSTDKAKA